MFLFYFRIIIHICPTLVFAQVDWSDLHMAQFSKYIVCQYGI